MATLVDFICFDDLEPTMRIGSEDELRKMQAYHRITTDTVFGFTDDHVNFGVDLRKRIGSKDYGQQELENDAEEAIRRDPWVLSVTATAELAESPTPAERSYRLVIRVDTDSNPIDLVVLLTDTSATVVS